MRVLPPRVLFSCMATEERKDPLGNPFGARLSRYPGATGLASELFETCHSSLWACTSSSSDRDLSIQACPQRMYGIRIRYSRRIW